MYIVNDICYAGSAPQEIRVAAVKPLIGRMLLVTFTTGEQRLFDCLQLKGAAFDPLTEEKVFNNPSIFHGIITWNNGEIDISPEMVYENSYPYGQEIA